MGPRNRRGACTPAVSIPLTVGHEEFGDEVDVPVSATPHCLGGLLSLAKVLVQLQRCTGMSINWNVCINKYRIAGSLRRDLCIFTCFMFASVECL